MILFELGLGSAGLILSALGLAAVDLILSGLGLVTADLAASELHLVTADLIDFISVELVGFCHCGPDFIRVGPGHSFIADRILSELDPDFI